MKKDTTNIDTNLIPAHFTASAVIIYLDHILLVNHKRIGAWLPPGGHLEEGELPHQACLREVFEETGVLCEIVSGFSMADNVVTGDADAFILPSPLCMQRLLAFEKGAAVIHIDLAYLCRPLQSCGKKPDEKLSLPELISSEEVQGARWCHLDELENLALAKNVREVVAIARMTL